VGGPEREPGDGDDGSKHADHQRPGEHTQVTVELTAQLADLTAKLPDFGA
jgi:hypothetical protein